MGTKYLFPAWLWELSANWFTAASRLFQTIPADNGDKTFNTVNYRGGFLGLTDSIMKLYIRSSASSVIEDCEHHILQEVIANNKPSIMMAEREKDTCDGVMV